MSGAIKINGTSSGSTTITAPASGADESIELSTALAAKAGISGSVLQVVSGTYSTQVSSTSATFADTGLSASITPSLATSKVLVLVSQAVSLTSSNTGNMTIKFVRGSTDIATFVHAQYANVASSVSWQNSNVHVYLDSPATTSATTYKTQFAMPTAVSTTGYVQRGSATSTILLLEIGA